MPVFNETPKLNRPLIYRVTTKGREPFTRLCYRGFYMFKNFGKCSHTNVEEITSYDALVRELNDHGIE